MGLLIVDNHTFHNNKPELEAAVRWMRRECHAELVSTATFLGNIEFHIEGLGIPHGRCEFGIHITPLIDNVLIIKIIK